MSLMWPAGQQKSSMGRALGASVARAPVLAYVATAVAPPQLAGDWCRRADADCRFARLFDVSRGFSGSFGETIRQPPPRRGDQPRCLGPVSLPRRGGGGT